MCYMVACSSYFFFVVLSSIFFARHRLLSSRLSFYLLVCSDDVYEVDYLVLGEAIRKNENLKL